jgi:Na+/H+ antiporter NhaD/arsenite permease-like protein
LLEFSIFGLTLLGVAVLHRHSLRVAVSGLVVVTMLKTAWLGFGSMTGFEGLVAHLAHEWVSVSNLLGLLLGFAILSRHFEQSGIPKRLPQFLPDDWKGGFALLVLVFVLSAFLDNIAAAIIGGTIAASVFRGKVHVGYLAGIVAASNAGGSGSVVGDTTTTMMWIAGASPLAVLHAYTAAVTALLITAWFAARQQQAYSPIIVDAPAHSPIDRSRVMVVAIMLGAVMSANILANTRFAGAGDRFPVIAAALWTAILVCTPWRKPDWSVLPGAARGALFLLSLVLMASMMPVQNMPQPSWIAVLGLGFISAVFDNIPLTALAIRQDGYDWGMLAYAVGFGGSMVWFGSSAGVALTGQFEHARSVGPWLRHGWHVVLAYLVGFGVMLVLHGWHPSMLRPG